MVRNGRLILSHWHRPFRLRDDEPLAYAAQGAELCGGQDETPMASAADGETERGWATTVGPSISVDPDDRPNPGSGSNESDRGGEPCE